MTRASQWDRRYAHPLDPITYNEKRCAKISALIHRELMHLSTEATVRVLWQALQGVKSRGQELQRA
jgi:hypothetical protein